MGKVKLVEEKKEEKEVQKTETPKSIVLRLFGEEVMDHSMLQLRVGTARNPKRGAAIAERLKGERDKKVEDFKTILNKIK